MTLTLALPEGTIHVPHRVQNSLAEFRRWAGDNDLPEKTRVDFYKGEVWVDMGKEQVFTHSLLKSRVMAGLGALGRRYELGYFWCSGILVTNEVAELSGNPDGTFVSYEAFASGRVKPVPGENDGFVELDGTADMVLEVVSDSSETKDTQTLRGAYWHAGIPEYWLVDGRGAAVAFDILRHGPKGYAASRKQAGWAKSAVFGRSFRLTRTTNPLGHPEFALEVK